MKSEFILEGSNIMPSDSEVTRRFSVLVESLNLPSDIVEPLMNKSLIHKRELLKGQESVTEGQHTVRFYINQLERHLDPHLRIKSPSKKLLKGLISVETLLTSLEVDLRSNPNATWLREFIDEPNYGHVGLLKLLKQLQDSNNNLVYADKTNSKSKKNETVLTKEPNDEHLCLLCIKAIVRNKYGFHQILAAPRSLSTMAVCLRLSNVKTKTVVLKIFSEACEHPGGFEKALQAFEDYKQLKQERYRFEGLVHTVIFNGRLNNPAYQEIVLHFFNALLSNAPSLNQRVFHQQELEQAGFSAEKVEKALEGLRADCVRDELNKWQNNYIDVSTTLDEFVSLKSRSTMLREEVDLLQTRLEDVGREKNMYAHEKRELERKVEEYKLRCSELHGKIENIKHQHPDSNKEEDITHAIEDVVDEILRPLTPPIPAPPPPPMRISSIPSSPTSPAISPPPPPLIPPPPPPDLGSIAKDSQAAYPTSSARLPMLHWQPITRPSKESIFMQLSPNSISERLNFAQLDEMFELKQPTAPTHTLQREAALLKLSTQVTVLNANKARNILIARKRISLEPEDLVKAINACDVVALNPECAELLLKFTPTPEERSALLKCSSDIENMAEAEKFMIQLTKIERLESKLNTMAFIGSFDELFRTVSPQIEAIITASVSVSTSQKLRQLLEIILAYGNYINGSRRGFTRAFKLDSLVKLDEIKTNDKKMSLLQYLVHMIRVEFPGVHTFYEDIEVQPTLNVSMETLTADVQHLRKGLDVAKSERDKQPENYVIHNFYNRAMLKIQQISERYRKMDELYKEVCFLFCEDPKTTEPAKFFNGFQSFINRYKRATKEIDEHAQEEKTLRKAEHLKSQNEKIRQKSAKLAADAVQKRRSLYDQNEYRTPQERPLSEMYYGNGDVTDGQDSTDKTLNNNEEDAIDQNVLYVNNGRRRSKSCGPLFKEDSFQYSHILKEAPVIQVYEPNGELNGELNGNITSCL